MVINSISDYFAVFHGREMTACCGTDEYRTEPDLPVGAASQEQQLEVTLTIQSRRRAALHRSSAPLVLDLPGHTWSSLGQVLCY